MYGMNEQTLLSAIQNDKLFGLILCDIETPDHLKHYFFEFCPILKNVEVGRDDIGEHMQKFAEANGLLTKPQKMLIGSFLPKNVYLSHLF